MKFNKKIKDILLEMPHIGFNTNSKMITFDFKVEKFQKNYEGFLNHVKNFMSTLENDQAYQEFFNEINSNDQLALSLKKFYPSIYGDLINSAATKKFISEIKGGKPSG